MPQIDPQDAAEFAAQGKPPAIDPADLAEFNATKTTPTPSLLGQIREAAPSLYTSIYENPMLGAEQRTAPQPQRYGEPLSTDLYVSDAGEVSFRDKSGNIVPTEVSKHVLLRGPDNRPTVYQRSEATTESPVVGAARVLSLGLGPIVPTTARVAAAVGPAAEASIPDLKAAATAVYQDPEILARPVALSDVASAFRQVSPQLRQFDPQITEKLSNTLRDLGTTQGLRLSDLDHASTRLGYIAEQTQMTASGLKATPEAAAATIVKKQLDGLIRQIAPEFEIADKNWTAARATETIVNRADKAEVLARGGDFAARMKTQATNLLTKPQYLRGFTPDEVEQIRQISQGSLAGDKLRQLNSWLSGRLAGLGAAGGGALLGHQLFGGVGAAVGGVGGAVAEGALSNIMTRLGNRLTANQVDALSSAVRARSPLGQQLAQNAADWEAAWRDIKMTPTSFTLTALARASRDLSTALQSVGVKVRPNELMRGVEAPGQGQAGEDQQQIPRPIR